MDNILSFFEINKTKLINYDQSTIDELYEIIIQTKNNLSINEWVKKSTIIIQECEEIFSIINYKYINFIDSYIIKLSKCIETQIECSTIEITYIVKKIKLYIQLLKYLKIIYFDKIIFFDELKYDIIIDTYNIFFNLNDDINKSYVEWITNNYIVFYSQSLNFTNICIYLLNDLYGYKIFLTFTKNNSNNTIKIYTFDCFIKTNKDFCNKFSIRNNYKPYSINIKQIANCFNKNNKNVIIEYLESNYIDKNKMLEYVRFFLNSVK